MQSLCAVTNHDVALFSLSLFFSQKTLPLCNAQQLLSLSLNKQHFLMISMKFMALNSGSHSRFIGKKYFYQLLRTLHTMHVCMHVYISVSDEPVRRFNKCQFGSFNAPALAATMAEIVNSYYCSNNLIKRSTCDGCRVRQLTRRRLIKVRCMRKFRA